MPAEHASIVAAANALPGFATAPFNCFCEMTQAGDLAHSSPEELKACQYDASDFPVIMGGKDDGKVAGGYCYIDAATSPALGNPDLVKSCPASYKRILRFITQPMQGATTFIHCASN